MTIDDLIDRKSLPATLYDRSDSGPGGIYPSPYPSDGAQRDIFTEVATFLGVSRWKLNNLLGCSSYSGMMKKWIEGSRMASALFVYRACKLAMVKARHMDDDRYFRGVALVDYIRGEIIFSQRKVSPHDPYQRQTSIEIPAYSRESKPSPFGTRNQRPTKQSRKSSTISYPTTAVFRKRPRVQVDDRADGESAEAIEQG